MRHGLRSDRDTHDPVGAERYRLLARYHNGTDLDLEETYAWGWEEIHAIEVRHGGAGRANLVPGPRCANASNGWMPTLATWSRAPTTSWPGTRKSSIERSPTSNGKYFEIAEPLRRCQSMATPAGGPATTYYTPPSEDFSRPGQIWHPVEGRTHFSLWDALSTAYHESTPGHHLQLAQMMYQAESLTRFQRLAVFNAGHGEGWALYAERLMHELGYLEDPVYELGWLVGQALRAARVILDIGLHCELRIPNDERFHPGERWRPEIGAAVPARANRLLR